MFYFSVSFPTEISGTSRRLVMNFSRRLRSLAICVLMVGCGDGGGGMTTPDGSPATGDGGCSSTSSPSAPPDGRVAGTWAALEITTARVNGFDSPQIARNIYLYQHAAGAGAVVETLCHLQIDD